MHGRPSTPEEIRAKYHRVWDMVKSLVHPAALYVVLELAAAGHLSASPALSGARHGTWVWFLIFGCQFLGAWAVFYSTLLRDAGIRSYAALGLTSLAALNLAAECLLYPDPSRMGEGPVRAFLALHLAPAAVVWAATMVRWHRLRRRLARLIEGRK